METTKAAHREDRKGNHEHWLLLSHEKSDYEFKAVITESFNAMSVWRSKQETRRTVREREREILKREAHTHAEKSCCLSVVKLSLLCLCCRIVIPVSRFGSQYFASWRTTVRVLSLEWEKQVHFERCVSLSLSEESVQCVVLLQKQ